MFDFLSEVQQHFGTLIGKFNLKIMPVDNSECLFVGDGFALAIAYDRDGLDVNYIDTEEADGMRSYRLTNFLSSQRFTADDRLSYGQPINGNERVMASMRVFASGLEKRCTDILSGDKAWLSVLKKKDADLWSGISLPQKVAVLLPH